jgi:starch phosphorylase
MAFMMNSDCFGKELHLTQQYCFVSCSIRDLLHRYTNNNRSIRRKNGFRPNDKHPTIVELMRLFLDGYHVPRDDAWPNQTLLLEALEAWSIDQSARMLPPLLAHMRDESTLLGERSRGEAARG